MNFNNPVVPLLLPLLLSALATASASTCGTPTPLHGPAEPTFFGAYGANVAVSGDGSAALVGASGATTKAGYSSGAVYVFGAPSASGNGARPLVAELLPSAASGNASAANSYFGSDVALSADGSVALVGAYMASSGVPLNGTATVYRRAASAGAYEPVAALVGKGGAGDGWFGDCVALSADGSVAVVGAPDDDSLAGAVYAYRASAASGYGQVARVAGDGTTVPQDQFGSAVAVSADGSVFAVARPGKNRTQSAVFVYRADGGGFELAATLEPSAAAFGRAFCGEVALSADGLQVVVGSTGDYPPTDPGARPGRAFVFRAASAGGPYKQVAELAPPKTNFGFGLAVAADAKAGVVVVGAAGAEGNSTAFVYTSGADGKLALAQAVVGPSGATNFGVDVAVSSDGTAVVAGAGLAAYSFSC